MPSTRRNPPAIPADTSREAWLVERAIRARQTPAERLRELAAFQAAVVAHQFASLRRRYPSFDDREARFALLRAWYGDETVEAAWPDAPPKPPKAVRAR